MKSITALCFAFLLALAGPSALADEAAAGQLAGILTQMNHFPDEEQKAQLQAIAADPETSDDLQAIARAIGDIAHQATAEDKAALQQIVDSDSTEPAARALARAVLGFNHKVAAEDAQALADVAQP